MSHEVVYRDEHDKALTEYPRPSVAVDTVALTLDLDEGGLKVLEVRQPMAGWALPGTFLHERERLIEAVLRSLRDKAGIEGLMPRQLHVFDNPTRDNRGWVLSVAHLVVVPKAALRHRRPDTRLSPVDAPGRLPHEHRDIIDRGLIEIRDRYAATPDPYRLLPDEFTVLDLWRVHEAIAGRLLQKDTFRRLMEPNLVRTGEWTSGTRGRPAELLRRR